MILLKYNECESRNVNLCDTGIGKLPLNTKERTLYLCKKINPNTKQEIVSTHVSFILLGVRFTQSLL